jgi:hypothetical protein
MTDAELMARLREITEMVVDPQILAHINVIERAGNNVSVFEILQTGALLMIVHAASRPSMAAIRTAYERQMAKVTQ